MGKKAIIIGAGPAGLTAAYELLKRTDIQPVLLEKSGHTGGISKTIEYKGNRMDIGGHRFFSKSDRVMEWWLNILPLQHNGEKVAINYHNQSTVVTGNKLATGNKGMLIRKRLSRIYFLRKFFNYPVQLSFDTLCKLGLFTTIHILCSYLYAQVFPRQPENSLEDFLINRFGKKLYRLFFKDYTEKVWGVPCRQIPAGWGAQRIKGVSISKAISHAASQLFKKTNDIAQKNTETSLIEQFLYPALGPGHLWEEVAQQVVAMGGEIRFFEEVKELRVAENTITGVVTQNTATKATTQYNGDYFFSTMPVQELVAGMGAEVPVQIREIAKGLQYRDFIIVGILLNKQAVAAGLKDTWIYIQERDVKAGRLQLFNNWSPYMAHTPGTVWMGMEYFCNKDDAFWQMSDAAIQQTAIDELEKMGLAKREHVLDSTVHREEKTYPAYFGTYEQFDEVKEYVEGFSNLYLVGRNGMHKYNNADHSMLTAMTAVDNIVEGRTSKANIWAINMEQEYHEEKTAPVATEPSFGGFLWQHKWAICISALLFIVFKWLYPFPGFMPDSSSYIEAAEKNYAINFWPIGYSKFLQLFHFFSQSDLLLVLFQYMFLQAALLYVVYTIGCLVKPGKRVQLFLVGFFVLNPVYLVTGNYVSSDALFTGISCIWVTQLLWLIYRPVPRLLWLHALVLLVACVIRFNAMYYPLISVAVIFSSRLRMPLKLAGSGLSVLLVALFAWYCSDRYQQLTGKKQLAAFAGWQMAGNGLFAYSHVTEKDKPVPRKFLALHQTVRHHLDSLNRLVQRPDSVLGAYYVWHGPLAQYYRQQSGDSTVTNFKHYALLAPMYKEYGQWLIKNYPFEYLRYFLWPNLVRYYAPPAEFLEQYNIHTQVDEHAKNWFGYKQDAITGRSWVFPFMNWMPILSAFINLLFIGSLLGFWMMGGFRKAKQLKPLVVLVSAIWLANFGFSVLASPIVLRYQLFALSLMVCIGVLLTDYIYHYDQKNDPGSSRAVIDPALRLRGYEQAAGV